MLRRSKKIWLMPLIIAMILVAILIVVGELTGLGSVIYTLF